MCQGNEQFQSGTVVGLGLYAGRRLLRIPGCVGFKWFRFQKFWNRSHVWSVTSSIKERQQTKLTHLFNQKGLLNKGQV